MILDIYSSELLKARNINVQVFKLKNDDMDQLIISNGGIMSIQIT